MTEDEAQRWARDHVPRETMDRLRHLAGLVIAEAAEQNLIAASTIDTIWSRHIVDSLQLAYHAPESGRWLDLGSGAGFPGLVIASLGRHHVTLAESRSRRVAFLRDAIDRLGIAGCSCVAEGRVERLTADPFAIISARAFAPLDRLFATSHHLSSPNTRWVLPKGRAAQAELDAVRGSWQGDFRIAPSVTDPDAAIIVADRVRPRHDGRRAGSAR